jgi:hypothetical protein
MLPNNPDDLLRTVTRLMDDLIREMGASEEDRIISYTVLAAGPGETPTVFRMLPEARETIRWEVVEGEGEVYITVLVPPDAITEPSIILQPLLVRISLDGETSVVNLPCRIDVRSCSFQVKNGVLDIACRKA